MPSTSRSATPKDRLQSEPQSKAVQIKECSIRSDNGARGWLGYRRCHDFDAVPEDQGIGQDSAALYSDERFVVGVVSDGVSQSFYGNIAATILTDSLIERLWENRAAPPDAETFEKWLLEAESEMAQAVQTACISDRLPAMLQKNLESSRKKKGSQAVFAAFVWDHEAPDALRERGCLHVYQVGDPFLYAFVKADSRPVKADSQWETIANAPFEETTLRFLSEPGGRISSLGQSQRHLAHSRLNGVQGVAVHSDGTPPEWGTALSNLDAPSARIGLMQPTLKNWMLEWAEKDDVSFVVALTSSLQQQIRSRGFTASLQPPDVEKSKKPEPPIKTGKPVETNRPRVHEPAPRSVNTAASAALFILIAGGAFAGFHFLNHPQTADGPEAGSSAPQKAIEPPPAPVEPKKAPKPINLNTEAGQHEALKALEYWNGSQTFKEAVENYQSERGLQVDGGIGPKTRSKLAADLKAKGIPSIP